MDGEGWKGCVDCGVGRRGRFTYVRVLMREMYVCTRFSDMTKARRAGAETPIATYMRTCIGGIQGMVCIAKSPRARFILPTHLPTHLPTYLPTYLPHARAHRIPRVSTSAGYKNQDYYSTYIHTASLHLTSPSYPTYYTP